MPTSLEFPSRTLVERVSVVSVSSSRSLCSCCLCVCPTASLSHSLCSCLCFCLCLSFCVRVCVCVCMSVCVCVCARVRVCGRNELEVCTMLAYPHIGSFRTMPVHMGASVKLVCSSECPSQSFVQEVAKGRGCHFRADF